MSWQTGVTLEDSSNVQFLELVGELLDAARLASSTRNCQPRRFVVIKSLSCKERLVTAVSQLSRIVIYIEKVVYL